MAAGIAVALPPTPAAEMLPDGGAWVDLDGPDAFSADALAGLGHGDNLAGALSETVLSGLAHDLVEAFEADWDSNADRRATLEEGLKLLGTKPGQRLQVPFAGATGVVHPMLMEAGVRFQCNATAELFPASGPARMQVAGDAQPDTEARSKRKQDWLNYHLTVADRGYKTDFRQQMLMTGLYGSTFKRVFQDPRIGKPRSRFLTEYDFVMASGTASLDDCERYTYREQNVSRAEMRRLQLAGYYRDVSLTEPLLADADGPRDMVASVRQEDAQYELLHVHALLDVEGLEHVDEAGEPTGLPLPYVVSIERESRAVLRLVRNWLADDPLFLPRTHFVHYQYHPGLDVYGWGLIHLGGQSADAATTLLRQAINAFTLSAFPGGFKVKGLKSERPNEPIAPCEFREVDSNGLPIQSAIMSLPYKDVPPSFSTLFEAVVSAGQRLCATGDMAVGDGREDALPGTVTALIEKATRVESATIKALHDAMAQELRLLADLFGQDPDETYPYTVKGRKGEAVGADFQDNDDIFPVSDPNAPTQTQRLTLAQGKLKLAQAGGTMFNQREAFIDMMRALGTTDQDIERLMPPPQQKPPVSADPVTELQAMLAGAPVAARPDQDHAAHIAVHGSQVAMPGVANTPIAAMLAAHIAEHVGMLYRARMGMALGQPLPPVGPVPPQVEAVVTQAVAGVAMQVAQSMPGAVNATPTKPDIGPNEAALKARELDFREQDAQRKAQESARGDMVQATQMQMEAEQNAADRAQKQRDNATKVATSMLAVASAQQEGEQAISREAVAGTAEIMAEAQRQAGEASRRDHEAGIALLAKLR